MSHQMSNQMPKYVLCQYMYTQLGCFNGQHCKYAHSLSELQQAKDTPDPISNEVIRGYYFLDFIDKVSQKISRMTKWEMDIDDVHNFVIYYIFIKIMFNEKKADDPLFITTKCSKTHSAIVDYLSYQYISYACILNVINCVEEHMKIAYESIKKDIEVKDKKQTNAICFFKNGPNNVANPFTFASCLRYSYMNIGNIGLALCYKEWGFKPNDDVLECFASPMNRYFNSYCSAFPDVDVDSSGNFFKKHYVRQKIMVCNPPFEMTIMNHAISHVVKLCKKNKSLSCIFIFPKWNDWFEEQTVFKQENSNVVTRKVNFKGWKNLPYEMTWGDEIRLSEGSSDPTSVDMEVIVCMYNYYPNIFPQGFLKLFN